MNVLCFCLFCSNAPTGIFEQEGNEHFFLSPGCVHSLYGNALIIALMFVLKTALVGWCQGYVYVCMGIQNIYVKKFKMQMSTLERLIPTITINVHPKGSLHSTLTKEEE